MIIDNSETELTGNLKFARKVPMNLSADAAPIIIRSLTNLYSNPYTAVLREYTSNAYDSHVRAGQTRPVEVSLPSRMSPNLVIEDFGVGMDVDELDSYGQYGDSSKQKTNDQIGGFGLGSKSGLAICSQFTVSSVKDGFLNTMVVGYDEDGRPTLGYLNDAPVPTDKPNGVKVTIPTTEYGQFDANSVREMFIGWPKDSVSINGLVPEKSVYDETQYTAVKDAGWLSVEPTPSGQYYNYRYNGVALVGPVRYSIDWSKIPNVTDRMATGFLRDAVLKLDIGAVKLVPSREQILYTAETRAAIASAIDEIKEHGKTIIQQQVTQAPTIREALKKRELAENYGFRAQYTWGGAPLEPAPMAYDKRDATETAVTSAFVNQYTYSRATYKVQRDAPSLYHQEQIIKLGITNDNYVLVVDAGNAVQAKKGSYSYQKLHETAKKNLVPYVRGEVEEAPESENRRINDSTYVFTSYKKSELDRNVLGAFSTVIEHDDFVRLAEERRKAIVKRAREKTKADGGTTTTRLTRTDVRILSYVSNGKSYSDVFPLDELDTSKKYILLDNSHWDAQVDTTLESKLREAVTTNVRYSSELDAVARVLRQERGVTFLLTNKSTNLTLLNDTLPNITTINDEIEKYLESKSGTITPAQAQALYDLENSRLNWATTITDTAAATITRTETREWLLAVRTPALRKTHESLQSAVKIASGIGIDVSKYQMQVVGKNDSPAKRYPLLNEIWSGRAYSDAIVQYINLIDADLTAKEEN